METQYGRRQLVHIVYDDTVHKCWTTSDIVKLITEDTFKKIWTDPCFSHFLMKFDGKANQKYIFSIVDIVTADRLSTKELSE